MTRTDRTPAENLNAALTTRQSDTPAHRALHKALAKNTKRLAAAQSELRQALDERRNLFRQGRGEDGLEPVEPFARLAAIAGVTEAAVIQAIAGSKNGDST